MKFFVNLWANYICRLCEFSIRGVPIKIACNIAEYLLTLVQYRPQARKDVGAFCELPRNQKRRFNGFGGGGGV